MATAETTVPIAPADPIGEINKYDFRTATKEIFRARKGLNAEIVRRNPRA